MADQELSGAQSTITVDNASVLKEDKKKQIIKYVIIALALVGGYILIRKFVLKK